MASKIKTVMIAQAKPTDENSPYFALGKKWNLKMEFRNFIRIEGHSVSEFRKQNLDPLKFTAVILTSKHAVDHYFRICKEMRIELPPDMKYFCVGETTAKYLQKYITIRKRKLFVGEKTAEDLIDLVKKNTKDKYIFPCGNLHRTELTNYMHQNGYELKEAIVYQTVPEDLTDMKELKFDLICFFSPSAIDSLFKNFPNFEQGETRVAVFGPTTSKAAIDTGLRVDIEAPLPNMPSMTAAIESYLKVSNK